MYSLLEYLPELLKESEFRKAFTENLGEKLIPFIESSDYEVNDDIYELEDKVRGLFGVHGKNYLGVGWDGGAPGMSGLIWVTGLSDVFVRDSSDFDSEGPFNSLDEALDWGFLDSPISHANVWSDVLEHEELLRIATRFADWENEEEIIVNDKVYIPRKGRLISQDFIQRMHRASSST